MTSSTLRLRADLVPTPDGLRIWLDDDRWVQVRHPPAWLASRVADPSMSTRGWDQLAHLLGERAMVVHHAGSTPLAGCTVGIIGSGLLARKVAAALAQAGAGLVVHDPEPPSSAAWVHSDAPTCGHALARWLGRRCRLGTVRAVGSVEPMRECDLVLVLQHRVECDRVTTDELVRLGLAHLVVRAHNEVGRIGPLVLPGRSACLGCADRILASNDPDHAAVVSRLAARRPLVDENLLQLLVARTVIEVRATRAGRSSRLVDHVETIDVDDPAPRWLRLVRQPDCRCASAGSGGC